MISIELISFTSPPNTHQGNFFVFYFSRIRIRTADYYFFISLMNRHTGICLFWKLYTRVSISEIWYMNKTFISLIETIFSGIFLKNLNCFTSILYNKLFHITNQWQHSVVRHEMYFTLMNTQQKTVHKVNRKHKESLDENPLLHSELQRRRREEKNSEREELSICRDIQS